MKRTVLDHFQDLSDAVASGRAELNISPDQGADGATIRLDFKGSGGFVVARRLFSVPLPDAYAFTFKLRGAAPRNKFEFILVDPTGKTCGAISKRRSPSRPTGNRCRFAAVRSSWPGDPREAGGARDGKPTRNFTADEVVIEIPADVVMR